MQAALTTADADLVLAAQRGDREAFGLLYRRHVDGLHDFLARLTRSEATAADCTQEAFLTAMTRLDQLREPDRFRSWLFTIGHRAALKTCRSGDRTRATYTPTASPTPSATVSASPTEPTTTARPTPTEPPNRAPSVTIAAPGDGRAFGTSGSDRRGAYAEVGLSVSATDEDPGSLTWAWTSSVNGRVLSLARGTARLHTTSCVTEHTITATATDTAGASGADTVRISIVQPC